MICYCCNKLLPSASGRDSQMCVQCEMTLWEIDRDTSPAPPLSADLSDAEFEFSPPSPLAKTRSLKSMFAKKRPSAAAPPPAKRPAIVSYNGSSLLKLEPSSLCIDPLMALSPPFPIPAIEPALLLVGHPFYASRSSLGRPRQTDATGPQAEMLTAFASFDKAGYTYLQLKYLRVTKRQGKAKPPRVQHLFGYMPLGNFYQLLQQSFSQPASVSVPSSVNRHFGETGVARADLTFLEFIPDSRPCKLHFDIDMKSTSEPTQ